MARGAKKLLLVPAIGGSGLDAT
ncbi:hypothetical protein MESS2_980082 [Mesorhizobium metallidurans STM 2683]|uniref:Uncharacterized protein n=4 Tax=Mesorhizobium TaxID=68287 RepID=A0A1R3V7Y3_9HYPH|nr:conserved hypothetical protein [Mesorhizobium ventifaucium]CCV09359.1 hypothetical protein MESS2_980082 [Mesorhizobium metallidurans STM 2683]SIT55932.1 conserved hypothetical protein [Mesorhizobium prunaredense]SJM34719.1 conserved hypothetical protein [Mesorhizobium delmotii]